MMSGTTTNMRKIYCEHKDLSRIPDKLWFASLHKTLLEIKANSSSVPWNLGGGAHGYTGIILSPATYSILSPMISCIITTHLGPLQIPIGATQYVITHADNTTWWRSETILRVYFSPTDTTPTSFGEYWRQVFNTPTQLRYRLSTGKY